jgi:hypothetical protein
MLLQKGCSETCLAAEVLSHGRAPSEIISQNSFLRECSHFLRKLFSKKMDLLKFIFKKFSEKK